ncbi:MAG: hypothetical protein HUK02_01555, partial [Bacteroidaceae bacterium]|nr:hypothetical protein [Bacteroidaceae bacterium]
FAGAPTTLVSAQLPNPIQSWYNEGDPAALCTYTFTKDIQSARARLEMGQGEGTEDLYQEYIADDHISFDGKTVTVDLSGVMRTQKTMNLKYSWSEFTVVLFDVIDTDGNETFCEDQGAVSSYKYTAPFKDITGTISAEFSPASGAAITEATKNIEIWFNNSSLIQWDGVTFTYYTMEEVSDVDEAGQPVVTMQNVAHEVFVPKADLTAETIDNETTITVPVPAGLCQATDIRVAVNITGATDGAYHVIVAYYNNTLSHGLDLARFATPADQTTVGLLHEIYLTLDMTHAINTKVSQPVKVTGTATKFGCSGKIVDDGMMGVKIVLDEYITAPDTYVVTIAEGVVGDYVYGESDYKSGLTNTACTLTYTVNGQYAGKPVIIDPAEGPVERLQHFTLEFFEYASVAPTWNMEAQPYVEDADGVRTDAEFQEMMDAGNVVAIRLSKEITADGTYTLVVPAGAVCNGAQGDPLETEYRFTYTIGEPTAIGSIHATPASTTAIYTVSGQRVTKANAPGLYIVGGKKVVVK